MNCPLCNKEHFNTVYEVNGIPAFQNKVYSSIEASKAAITANIKLSQCNNCGFVFNSTFDNSLMNYDKNYQNEQSYSLCFKDHLNSVTQLLVKNGFLTKNLIEVGCGKGYFLEQLTNAGFNVTGFDPAYEGSNKNIIKEYFSDEFSDLNGDLIILRHVLEHIHQPLEFLHNVARSVNYNAKVYIEVPDLQWVLENQAYWDIFYEHCNYFNTETLGGLFRNSECGSLFGGQYIYILADLNELNSQSASKQADLTKKFLALTANLIAHKNFISKHSNLVLWGAGAKGATFANLIDPSNKHIVFIVDINPKKQNRFIAKSCHPILSADNLSTKSDHKIIVMNDNYFNEIKRATNSSYELYCLGDIK